MDSFSDVTGGSRPVINSGRPTDLSRLEIQELDETPCLRNNTVPSPNHTAYEAPLEEVLSTFSMRGMFNSSPKQVMELPGFYHQVPLPQHLGDPSGHFLQVNSASADFIRLLGVLSPHPVLSYGAVDFGLAIFTM